MYLFFFLIKFDEKNFMKHIFFWSKKIIFFDPKKKIVFSNYWCQFNEKHLLLLSFKHLSTTIYTSINNGPPETWSPPKVIPDVGSPALDEFFLEIDENNDFKVKIIYAFDKISPFKYFINICFFFHQIWRKNFNEKYIFLNGKNLFFWSKKI